MYVLDTDILIDVLRGHQPAIDWFSTLTEVPSISDFVVIDFYYFNYLVFMYWYKISVKYTDFAVP